MKLSNVSQENFESIKIWVKMTSIRLKGECKKDQMIYISQAILGPILWPIEKKYLKLK